MPGQGEILRDIGGLWRWPQYAQTNQPILVRAVMVCRASGNYGIAFKAGRGVTQGGPLSATLFNIVVTALHENG
jgi:hypothetical protein